MACIDLSSNNEIETTSFLSLALNVKYSFLSLPTLVVKETPIRCDSFLKKGKTIHPSIEKYKQLILSNSTKNF